MKHTKILYLAVFLALGCQQAGKKDVEQSAVDTTEEYVPIDATTDSDEHNAQNSLDVEGTYEGTIPCADCEGIKTVLSLADSSYVLKSTYLGKGDGASHEAKGAFQWVDGNTIELKGVQDSPARFKVEEGQLLMLDMEGQPVTGELADHYVLKKAN